MGSYPEQLRNALDESGSVEDDLALRRIGPALLEIKEKRSRPLDAYKIDRLEARLRGLRKQFLWPVTESREGAWKQRRQDARALHLSEHLQYVRVVPVDAVAQDAVQQRGPARYGSDGYGSSPSNDAAGLLESHQPVTRLREVIQGPQHQHSLDCVVVYIEPSRVAYASVQG